MKKKFFALASSVLFLAACTPTADDSMMDDDKMMEDGAMMDDGAMQK